MRNGEHTQAARRIFVLVPLRHTLASASCVASWLTALAVAAPAAGIVVRHDTESEAFERLAGEVAGPLVWIRYDDGTGIAVAEGTLIAPSWVLTAAHAVEAMRPGATVVYGGEPCEVAAVYLHPGWTGKFEELHDLALLELRTPVAAPAPARLDRGALEAGDEIVVVGRGMSGTGRTGPVEDDGRLRAATNRLTEVGEKHLAFVFDAPGQPDAMPLEGISGPGDSGGPALRRVGGELVVVGVSSAQDDAPTAGAEGRYGVVEYYGRVSAFVGWIDGIVAASAARPPATARSPASPAAP